MKRSKKLIYNLFLSGFVSVVMRFIGLRFNVYLTNSVGAVGMGIYTLIMSVGGFAVTLALSGIGIGATRLCSDAYAVGKYDTVRKSVRICCMYALFFGLLSGCILYFTSTPVCISVLKNSECILPLKVFCFSLPFMSLNSALGGYFLSCQRVYKSLIAGVIQQFAAIGITVYFFNNYNFSENSSYYIILASVIGEVIGFIILLTFYAFEVKMHLKSKSSDKEKKLKSLLQISLPIAFSTYVRSILVSVEHILIPKGLGRFYGNTQTALSSYGTLHAMAMPIILFPMVIISSLSGLLVPEMSARNALCDIDGAKNVAIKVYKITLIYSIGCSGIMLFCSVPLGNLIYNSSQAGEYIKYVAPLIPIMYLDHVTDGMLKGLGEQLYCMKVNILDAGLSVILVFFVVPYYGVIGYIGVVYAMEIFNAFLSIRRLVAVCNFRIRIFDWIVKPLICICFSAITLKLIFIKSTNITGIELTAQILLCLLVYAIMLTLCGSITKNDIKQSMALF